MAFFRKQEDNSEDYKEVDMELQQKLRRLLFSDDDDDDNKSKKPILIAAGVVLFLFASYFGGYIAAVGKYGFYEASTLPFWKIFLSAWFSLSGLMYVVIFCAIIAGVFFLMKRRNKELDATKTVDERGVGYAEDGTYGTAEPLSRKEAEKVFEITDISKARGVILGQYSEKGKEVICLPENTDRNRNILILGSPGTGKSFGYVRNGIYQAVVRGESIVITDPKSELYSDMSQFLIQQGYKVKVFNTIMPQRSDSWDCVSEIYNPETGEVDDIRVADFADTLMKNTSEGKGDHFWDGGESNLLKAVITYNAWHREKTLKALYENEGKVLMNNVGHIFTADQQKLLSSVLQYSSEATIREKEKALEILIKVAHGKDKVKDYLKAIKLKAPACDIASIYHMLITSDIAALEEKFKAVPISHPAGMAWSIFKTSSPNTQPGFVQGVAQRLQLFQMRDIRRITTNEDIVIEDISKEKTALFIIISDKSASMKVITSLFFTFLFKDIADAADLYGAENRLSVNVIMDEAANLGAIPAFDKTMSTARSRKINISPILQSVSQLTELYGPLSKETIISCCDTVLFLGCNDSDTASFVSDLSGVATIRALSTKDTRTSSLGYRGVAQGYSISEGDGKRNVMNADEVRRLARNEVLIYHNGCNILKANRCGFVDHPFSKIMPPPVRIRDYTLASEKYHASEHLDAFVYGDVTNLTSRNMAVVHNAAIDDAIEKDEGNKESKIKYIESESDSFDF